MMAMSLLSTYEAYRRDKRATASVYAAPAHPVRRALWYALSLIGLGMGGVAALDDDTLGIG